MQYWRKTQQKGPKKALLFPQVIKKYSKTLNDLQILKSLRLRISCAYLYGLIHRFIYNILIYTYLYYFIISDEQKKASLWNTIFFSKIINWKNKLLKKEICCVAVILRLILLLVLVEVIKKVTIGIPMKKLLLPSKTALWNVRLCKAWC